MDHINKINKLIPFAVEEADKRITHYDTQGLTQLQIDNLWNLFYHRSMDQITTDAGLRWPQKRSIIK